MPKPSKAVDSVHQPTQAPQLSAEAQDAEVWTAQDVAAYLRVSYRHVVTMATKRVIPGKQIGTAWRFKRSSIENMM